MPPFLVPAAILYIALAIARFRWAVFVLITLLPTYLLRFNIGWLPSTLLEVMIWVVVGVWAIRFACHPEAQSAEGSRTHDSDLTGFFASLRMTIKKWLQGNIKNHWPLAVGITLLLIAGTISMFIAPDLRAAAGLWKAYIIEPIALFVVFITTFKKDDIPKIIFALSLTALFTSTLAIYQKFTGWGIPETYWAAEETRRVTSVWGFPNAVGLFLAPLVPLFLWMSFRANRVCYLLVTLASILAIIFAKSTGALVGLAVALIIVGILHKKTRIVTIALTTIGAILILTIPRLAPIKQELLLQDYSGKLRRDMWAESIELLSEHPILGTGLSSYKTVVRKYRIRIDKPEEIFKYPHNIILNFWTELGALGVLAFVLIFYWLFKTAHATPALLAAFVIILIHGFVDVPYFKNDLAVQFWLLAALCYNTLTPAPSPSKGEGSNNEV